VHSLTDLLVFVSLGGCSGHALAHAVDLGELGDVVVCGGIDGRVKFVDLVLLVVVALVVFDVVEDRFGGG
jgi:hypothetical protein